MNDPEVAAAAAARARIVLVAEDEILIRAVAAEALRDAGYTVIEASSADEAERFVAAGLVPDVLFTDVRMPGTRDGLALARELKARLPRLIVLVASGHADPDTALPHSHKFFRKPYDVDSVLAAIAAALEQHEP